MSDRPDERFVVIVPGWHDKRKMASREMARTVRDEEARLGAKIWTEPAVFVESDAYPGMAGFWRLEGKTV